MCGVMLGLGPYAGKSARASHVHTMAAFRHEHIFLGEDHARLDVDGPADGDSRCARHCQLAWGLVRFASAVLLDRRPDLELYYALPT